MRSQCCRQTPSPILSENLCSVPAFHSLHARRDCELESVAETPDYHSKSSNYEGSGGSSSSTYAYGSSKQACSSRKYGSSSTAMHASAQLAPFSGTQFTCFTGTKGTNTDAHTADANLQEAPHTSPPLAHARGGGGGGGRGGAGGDTSIGRGERRSAEPDQQQRDIAALQLELEYATERLRSTVFAARPALCLMPDA